MLKAALTSKSVHFHFLAKQIVVVGLSPYISFTQFTWSSITGNNVITLEWWDAEGSIQVDPGFQLECRQFALFTFFTLEIGEMGPR